MSEFGRTFGLQWHITNHCDQRCKHCYIWGLNRERKNDQGDEMDISQCLRVADNFLNFCKTFRVDPLIALTGGDPLLFPWFWDLVEKLCRKKIPFLIVGNPFHLDQNTCSKLKKSGCVAYQMSLDGLEQTHDFIRQKGSFYSTLQAVKMLNNSGIKTMVMSTISKLNYREIPELTQFLVEQRVRVCDFARYCPTPNNTHLLLSPTEYQHFLSTMWDLYSEFKGGITKFPLKDHLWRLFLYEKGLFKIQKGKVVVQGCGCGIRHLTMLPNGIVYACRRFESPVGDIP